jgi:hypothetical protein
MNRRARADVHADAPEALDARDAAPYAAANPREIRLMLRPHRLRIPTVSTLLALALFAACTPKVQLEAPKEPITINMNIKIEHEIRVKVDKDLDQLFDENDELF